MHDYPLVILGEINIIILILYEEGEILLRIFIIKKLSYIYMSPKLIFYTPINIPRMSISTYTHIVYFKVNTWARNCRSCLPVCGSLNSVWLHLSLQWIRVNSSWKSLKLGDIIY